ncbi:MAG: alpha-L-fucosidase [Chthoniobacterales bacterium]
MVLLPLCLTAVLAANTASAADGDRTGGDQKSALETLAEDPAAERGRETPVPGQRPWVGRTREQIRSWARENLHRKLLGQTVIDASAHPEWAWFRENGLGLFLHWGPASLPPANGDAWAMQWSGHRQRHDMLQLPEAMFAAAEEWNPRHYDPARWMEAAARAGFGYAVLTTRHHDGYCLWPSAHGHWDTGDLMGGRDLVQDYVEACRRHGLRVGFYYSGPNWHFDYRQRDFSIPDNLGYNYLHEKTGIATPPDVERRSNEEAARQVTELLTRYGPVDMMWWDGNSIMTEQELAVLQPDIFVARGNIATPEGREHGRSENVKVTNEAGWWWELCIKPENKDTPYWHYNPVLETNHWSAAKILSELVRCRSLGGNLLVNVPPRPDGTLMDWFYPVCDEMAAWMKHSRESVVGVDLDPPRPTLDLTDNCTTTRGNIWYAMPDPDGRSVISGMPAPVEVALLRTGARLAFTRRGGELRVEVPAALRTRLPDMVKITFPPRG